MANRQKRFSKGVEGLIERAIDFRGSWHSNHLEVKMAKALRTQQTQIADLTAKLDSIRGWERKWGYAIHDSWLSSEKLSGALAIEELADILGEDDVQ